jgi:hypothetical protein
MEFKFSCKWFEISLAGDPGFVEVQLAKYEPYVFHVLKKIEHDLLSGESQEKKPAPPRPDKPMENAPEARLPDQRGQEPRGQEQRRGRDHRNRWDRRRRDNQSRKDGVAREIAPEEPDFGPEPVSRLAAGNNGSLPLPVEVRPERSKDALHDIAEGHGVPELPFEERVNADYFHNETGAEEGADPVHHLPAETAAFSEFVARRRAPRIIAEELLRVMEAKKPRTHHDRIMVFGYYMEGEGAGSDFTIAEITRCYRGVGQDPGINIEQVINHATRSGFILSHDKGRAARYKLSNKGKRYVEDGLKLS